jgi:hypothetical protein
MKKEALGGLLVLAIILYVLIALMGPGSKFGNAWKYLVSGQTSGGSNVEQPNNLPPATGTSILGSPSLSAQRIDNILCNAGSPACGTGPVFYADSLQYGIDNAYALAFFRHESSFGTNGAATQTLSIGNIVCTAGYSCIGRFRAYSSWADGITDWFKLIKNVYVGQWGATTVESIIPHYAPNSDNNDEAGYIASVENDVQSWRN